MADNGKNDKQRVSHKGNPIPPGLNPWKPGQSGNPGGRPRKLDFVDHLKGFFDEQVPNPRPQGPKMIPRLQYLAIMIGLGALREDGNPLLKRDCVKIVVDTLMPSRAKLEARIPIIAINPQIHCETAINFIAHLEAAAVGGEITPDIVLDLLDKHAKGRLAALPKETIG